jgi:hypothetical protein
MRNYQWLLAGLALVAAGLIAGCGGSSSSTTGAVTGTVSGPNGSATVTGTTTSASGGATPTDVYNACLDAIKGTAAESAGQTACSQAKDAFEQCITQASNAPEGTARDTALKACQTAANKATAALKSAP